MASSSSTRPWHYDVFLSFDTRNSFTDRLYAALCHVGIHAFRGQDIKAIGKSKISIIVFSRNYASSRWCLDELVEILECRERVDQVVLPVFYDVDPSEVRKQPDGSRFGDDLVELRLRFGDENVRIWKAALTRVANFAGWDLHNKADGHESEFIDKIVKKVVQIVRLTYIDVGEHLVGMDARVREVLSLIQSEGDDDVRMIGIYGMAGVGKTTLAKAIYNQISREFGGSCFLDVRSEYSEKGSAALKHLQKQILCDTLKTTKFEVGHVDRGISLIKARLGSRKLLVVVDNVDSRDQLDKLAREKEWFGPGSRIIITTRNVRLLNGRGNDYRKYEVKVLCSHESLLLFSCHAFRNPNPLGGFVELSRMIVSHAAGLPLALKVLGSHFGSLSSIKAWRDEWKKLRRIPHGDILKILKISYDALDEDTQQVFLDIACFFRDWKSSKEEIFAALNACGFFAESGILTLIDRCLLSGKHLFMHDLIRDMGREIVRTESRGQPERRSRLFFPDEILDVLENNKGTEAIETMIVCLQNDVHFSTEVFSKMTRLRFLSIKSLDVSGPFKFLPNELRFLEWNACPLRRIPSDLSLSKLVVLDMYSSNIEEFEPSLQSFGCLEIFRLRNCKQLKRAPDFTGARSIKRVSFANCWNLAELPEAIGDLDELTNLNLVRCKNLKALPNSICKLKSLECLDLASCSKLKKLPNNLGELEQLRMLNARETSVLHLPYSCGRLKNLTDLILGSSRNLESLDPGPLVSGQFTGYYVGCSSSSDVNLCSLKYLRAPYHSLEFFKHHIGSMSSLRTLDLSSSYFDALPFKLNHLSQLRNLYLCFCKNLRVLEDIPTSLKFLNISTCPLLERVPDLSGSNLSTMYFQNCNNLAELRGLENLVSVKLVDVRNCSALVTHSLFLSFLKALSQKLINSCSDIWVSKEMVPEYLCSSSDCALPLFLEGKLRLIFSNSDRCHGWCVVKYKPTGVELLRSPLLKPHSIFVSLKPNDVRLRCTAYAHFTYPIKVEELEVCIELTWYDRDPAKENFYTCIVYEEKHGELCFFPVKPNVVINYSPPVPRASPPPSAMLLELDTNMEAEHWNRPPRRFDATCIWDALRLVFFRCPCFSSTQN